MRVYSIFDSVDGEVNFHGQGHLTTFIRLAGCSLKCSYCDTQYARENKSGEPMTGNQIMTVNQIIQRVIESKPFKVTITGGEPLEQAKELGDLVRALRELNIFSTVETNGAHPIPSWPCSWVADYKLKSSGMQGFMRLDHFDALNSDSFIKFVISNQKDYAEAKEVIVKLRARGKWMRFAFSPVTPGLPASTLIQWMREDHINNAILNIQIHKLLQLSEDSPGQKP